MQIQRASALNIASSGHRAAPHEAISAPLQNGGQHRPDIVVLMRWDVGWQSSDALKNRQRKPGIR